jgi:hypothetical protein
VPTNWRYRDGCINHCGKRHEIGHGAENSVIDIKEENEETGKEDEQGKIDQGRQ